MGYSSDALRFLQSCDMVPRKPTEGAAMKRISPSMIIASVALFFSLAASAQAVTVQSLTVFNQAKVATLAKVERAIVMQSQQLSAVWDTPTVRFTRSGGWPIYLTHRDVNCVGEPTHGCHFNGPSIYVSTGFGRNEGYSYVLSHEVMETLVDPLSTGSAPYEITSDTFAPGFHPEVCDPTPFDYRINRVQVSDFIYPAFLESGQAGMPLAASGPYDEMGRVQYPLQAFPGSIS